MKILKAISLLVICSLCFSLGIYSYPQVKKVSDFVGAYQGNVVQFTKLSTVTNINGKVAATTTLFTGPVGKTCQISNVVIRVTNADTITVDPTMYLGSNTIGGTPYSNYATVSGFSLPKTPPVSATAGIGKSVINSFNSASAGALIVAGDNFDLNISVGATATTLTLAVDTFGYCY